MSNQVKIHLVTPDASVARTGNRCTAQQWADILDELGCDVSICGPEDAIEGEMLVALHGGRSHDAIRRFREGQSDGKIIVAMTGTDIYPDPSAQVLESIQLADRIVVLQSKAIEKIPSEYHHKVRVIVQSAEIRAEKKSDVDGAKPFPICVVGHFRDVKDPLRAAAASRLLPADSALNVYHAGGILDGKYGALVDQEMAENPRYEWLGELDEQAVAELLANSRAMVLSSHAEGGARVVGEAIVHGTPVISSRIDAAVGLLGADYPAFFECGDTQQLADLLLRIEQDQEFYTELKNLTAKFAPQFSPDKEREAWREMIAELEG